MEKEIASKIRYCVFIAIFVLAAFIRLYKFPQHINFDLEQGGSLSTAYSYLHGKFSLLGLSNIQRTTSTGLQIYSGPIFTYSLIPIMLLAKYNPIQITYYALGVNLLTAILLFYLIYKISTYNIAFFATLYFLFSPTMIDQSRTLWVLNTLPLIGLCGTYILLKYKKSFASQAYFLFGILYGLSISLEWICAIIIIPIIIWMLYHSKSKIKDMLLICLGALIPLSPTLIFDLRHNWYHLRSLWQYLLDTLHNPGQSKFATYHLFPFIPLYFYYLGIISNWLISQKYKFIYLIATIYVVYGSYYAVSYYPPITLPTLLQFSQKIASLSPTNYNIVQLPGSEYRAAALRYILTAYDQSTPESVEAYPSSDTLFVISTKNRSLDQDIPWEMSSFNLNTKELISTAQNENILLYKFTK